jgi:hypothetical protein
MAPMPARRMPGGPSRFVRDCRLRASVMGLRQVGAEAGRYSEPPGRRVCIPPITSPRCSSCVATAPGFARTAGHGLLCGG